MNILMMFLKLLVVGHAILLMAIVTNLIAKAMGIMTWYDLLGEIGAQGLVKTLSRLDVKSWLFLGLVYPLSLAGVGYMVVKLCRL